MDVVQGVDALRRDHGPLFVVVGVFDGLHRGHAYLLGHLIAEASARSSRATVITFDHHPDEVLTGAAPSLLIDPDERLERLAAAGVEITVVQHFDDALRRTTYDDFVERIRARTSLTGFLMTADAAFGYERRGTPTALADLGRQDGFDVVVVPTFEIEGQSVRSSDIREAVTSGDLWRAERLLGRPFTLTGRVARDGKVTFAMPTALPPAGTYDCEVGGRPETVEISDGVVRVTATRSQEGRAQLSFARVGSS